MPELILDIDKDYARKKIFEELTKYPEEEQDRIIKQAGFGDRYKYDIKPDNPNFPSLPAIVALTKIFKQKDPTKTIEYFLYKDGDNLANANEALINIPYVHEETDRDNKLIPIDGKFCTTKYNILLSIAPIPTSLVLLRVDSDCMESTIYKNDELFINTIDKDIRDGAIYAFNSDTFKHIQIRRFYIQVNEIKIASDNKSKYDSYTASIKDLHILGRIILCRHFLV